jgi:CRP/FNR family transcriptional regulator, cyclic AMP receptor protein
MAPKSYLEQLRKIPLLSACSTRELQQVARAADEVDVDGGATLMKEGTRAREAFVIMSGTAEVLRAGKVVATVGPGDCVGELGLLDNEPRNATVVATEPMRLLVLPAQAFSALLEDAPGMTRKLLRYMAGRLRELDRHDTA